MYELKHVPSQNVVEFFGTAVLAERYFRQLVISYGEDALTEYSLTYQGEKPDEDFVIDGAILFETVHQLADEERKDKWRSTQVQDDR